MGITHFVGRSRSSIGPLRRVAMLPAAAFVSSCVFDIERLLISSSKTATDLAVSFTEVVGTESMMSTDGIVIRRVVELFESLKGSVEECEGC
jgi:hypothetical protein